MVSCCASNQPRTVSGDELIKFLQSRVLVICTHRHGFQFNDWALLADALLRFTGNFFLKLSC